MTIFKLYRNGEKQQKDGFLLIYTEGVKTPFSFFNWVFVNQKTIENNDLIALGMGGRIKVTRSIALTTEYYHRIAVKEGNPYYNSVGFGIDIETGGHVFQLVMTNAQGITERAFIGETTDNFFTGGIHLGFNVTRTLMP